MKYQSLRVLMVDDSEDDVFLVSRHIKKHVRTLIYEQVDDSRSMITALQKKPWDIVLCDYNMPTFDVLSAISLLKKLTIDIPIIIVSGTSDENAMRECMSLGARDYIMKNNLSNLCLIMERELERTEIRSKYKLLENDLHHSIYNSEKIFGDTIQFINSAIEARDPYKKGHQFRSADLAFTIATEMGLNKKTALEIRMTGSIHDIGSLMTPSELLAKPFELTKSELSLVKEHSQNGYDMLKNIDSTWPLAHIIHQHHERMDGSGYPRNLKGDDILMEARILAVSDVVESMTSNRAHRQALGIEAALAEIKQNSGILYDATAADVCLNLFSKKGYQLP